MTTSGAARRASWTSPPTPRSSTSRSPARSSSSSTTSTTRARSLRAVRSTRCGRTSCSRVWTRRRRPRRRRLVVAARRARAGALRAVMEERGPQFQQFQRKVAHKAVGRRTLIRTQWSTDGTRELRYSVDDPPAQLDAAAAYAAKSLGPAPPCLPTPTRGNLVWWTGRQVGTDRPTARQSKTGTAGPPQASRPPTRPPTPGTPTLPASRRTVKPVPQVLIPRRGLKARPHLWAPRRRRRPRTARARWPPPTQRSTRPGGRRP
mmetsp:Transcript_5127/g.16295  ORF Transcript_5127/g.16295 Transcript_5127/m.16295 type:complete len:262 (-) Transcript_5127:230-1015(-)